MNVRTLTPKEILNEALNDESGVVSSSGVGDGYYDAYVSKDESGAIVGAMIVFLDDGDNEEEEAA